MKITDVRQCSYAVVLTDNDKAFRRWPSANWYVRVWNGTAGDWEWESLSFSNPQAIKMERLYQDLMDVAPELQCDCCQWQGASDDLLLGTGQDRCPDCGSDDVFDYDEDATENQP